MDLQLEESTSVASRNSPVDGAWLGSSVRLKLWQLSNDCRLVWFPSLGAEFAVQEDHWCPELLDGPWFHNAPRFGSQVQPILVNNFLKCCQTSHRHKHYSPDQRQSHRLLLTSSGCSALPLPRPCLVLVLHPHLTRLLGSVMMCLSLTGMPLSNTLLVGGCGVLFHGAQVAW